MKKDVYGRIMYDEHDLCSMLMQDPDRVLSEILVHTKISGNTLNLENYPTLSKYEQINSSIEEYDSNNQKQWWMPKEYYELDIAKWVLEQCTTEVELQRAADELIKYYERDMVDLLRYLKYLVDTMRKEGIVWGVGRGSSVASYVLYLIGIHKIDSLYYDLSIDEFLK